MEKKNLQINYRNEYVSMGGENMADQKIEKSVKSGIECYKTRTGKIAGIRCWI